MSEQKSKFEFDRRRTIISKIGRAFLLLLVGAYFGMLTVIVFLAQNNAWWLVLCKIAIEVCWTFWLFAILYVWFDWAWLRTLYLHAERRLLRLTTFVKWVLPLFIVSVIGFVWYLHQIGILPLPPK